MVNLFQVMILKLEFGDKLRLLRERAELNQTQLGKAVGMSQRKVSYLECGKIEPNLADLAAISRFFHVSADCLLELPKNLQYLDLF